MNKWLLNEWQHLTYSVCYVIIYLVFSLYNHLFGLESFTYQINESFINLFKKQMATDACWRQQFHKEKKAGLERTFCFTQILTQFRWLCVCMWHPQEAKLPDRLLLWNSNYSENHAKIKLFKWLNFNLE